jgi:hypothetical protein
MARSAHAYVRGSTAEFYEWLADSRGNIPEGPAVWICGDCHVGNLGPLADAKGRVAIQVRDLDQTVIGNPVNGYEEQIATEIMQRLATDWSLFRKPGALVPETEGWFPPSRPRRGCEDC